MVFTIGSFLPQFSVRCGSVRCGAVLSGSVRFGRVRYGMVWLFFI